MRKIFVGLVIAVGFVIIGWVAVHIRIPHVHDTKTNTFVFVSEDANAITVDIRSDWPVYASRWQYQDRSHAGFDLEIRDAGKWFFSVQDLPLQDRPVAFVGVSLQVTQEEETDGVSSFVDGYSRKKYVLFGGKSLKGRAIRRPFKGSQVWNPDGVITFTEEEPGTIWKHVQ